MIPNSNSADVALANDPNNLNNVLAGVVYMLGNKVIFEVYTVNITTLAYTLSAQQVMNTLPAYGFPHIDMFAEDTAGSSVPLMHRFVVSWTEHDVATSTYFLKAAYGDMVSPATYTSATIRQANDELYADVAASNTFTGLNPHLNAYFIIENDDNQNLEFRELNCTSGVLGSLSTLSTKPTFLPRIEAMGLHDPSLSNNSWAAVAPLWNGVTYDVYVFNTNNLTGLLASSIFSGLNNRHVAIAAGIGPVHPQDCSLNYFFGWGVESGTTPFFVSRGVNYYSGSFTTPNYYQINTGSVPGIMDKVPLAMTSFSNSGKALITVWQIPGQAIYYKLTGSGTWFKPAPLGIGTSATKQCSVYPNPAHNQLTIHAAAKGEYTITNAIGQSLFSGKTDEKQTEINIQALSQGMYWLSLRSGAQTQHLKFIKL